MYTLYMNREFTLDYIAENTLPPQELWNAAQALGKHMVRHIRSEYTAEDSHYFHLEEADEALVGVSEQPDLTGEVVVTMHRSTGTWSADRQIAQRASYTSLKALPIFKAPYMGFNVMHVDTAQTLLQLAVPASPIAAYMMRNGYLHTHSGSPHHLLHVMERYNKGDLAFEPRRIQVAAQLTRRIINEQVKPSYFLMTPEEEEAFLDKHFPYQDVPLTGGGGKTVRRRVATSPLPKTPAPEPSPTLRRAPGVSIVDTRPIEVLLLPDGDVTE